MGGPNFRAFFFLYTIKFSLVMFWRAGLWEAQILRHFFSTINFSLVVPG